MTHSTRLTAAMIGLVLLAAPALVLLAYRDVETSILLAGLAAILGVVIAAVLMADALTRPLVEMADAVTTLSRPRTYRGSPMRTTRHARTSLHRSHTHSVDARSSRP